MATAAEPKVEVLEQDRLAGQEQEAYERAHYGRQHERWQCVWRHLTERERAELLRRYELEVVWDRLDDYERDRALAGGEADRAWPTLFDRLAQERAASRVEADREVAEANAELLATTKRLRDLNEAASEKLGEQIAAEEAEEAAAAEREQAERKARYGAAVKASKAPSGGRRVAAAKGRPA